MTRREAELLQQQLQEKDGQLALSHQQLEHLLAAVKIALCALRLQPEPANSARRGPGRPRKTTPSEKIN